MFLKTTITNLLSLSELFSVAISFTVFLHSFPPLLLFVLSLLLRLDIDPLFFRAAASAARVSFRDLLLLETGGLPNSASLS